jgi:predicted dehydrogenase
VAGLVIRVAVIGCGRQGMLHLQAYEAIGELQIAAVCEPDPARAQSAAELFSAVPYTRYEDLIAAEKLDLVSVVTMPATHREIVVAALRAGNHVLCEKPMALSLGEGLEMAAAARESGKTLTLGYNMRHMGSSRYLRSVVERGELGRVICMRAWCLDDAVPSWGRHYTRELAGGGVLMADAGHVLDLTLFVAGYPRPTTVTASATRVFPRKRATAVPRDLHGNYDVEDHASAHVRFADGTWLTLDVAWGWDAPGPSYSFELMGERAGLLHDPLRVMREIDGVVTDVTPAGVADIDWDASVRREIEAVVDAVRTGGAPVVAIEEALTVQAIVDACYRSALAGREVDVEPIA